MDVCAIFWLVNENQICYCIHQISIEQDAMGYKIVYFPKTA